MCSEETGKGLWTKEVPPCDAQLCCCYYHYYFLKGPQWGTANAESNVPSVANAESNVPSVANAESNVPSVANPESNVPSVANPELTSALSLKPGVGQNTASHASPNARIFFLS